LLKKDVAENNIKIFLVFLYLNNKEYTHEMGLFIKNKKILVFFKNEEIIEHSGENL